MTIASTILMQLGGNRFIAMTGARQLLDTGKGLQMTLPAGLTKQRANRVRITLQPNDTYRVETAKFARLDWQPVAEQDGIYADNLQQSFTTLTGLDCKL